MNMNKYKLGKHGEKIAEKYLRGQGVKIISKNYFTRFGEIDLIAQDDDAIVFIEVKFRTNDNYGLAVESVTDKKWEKLIRSAEHYLMDTNLFDSNCRFDVLSIDLCRKTGLYRIDWLKNQYFC